MPKDLRALADRFLKDQIRIMKKHGNGPKLGHEEYQKLLEDTRRAFSNLSEKREENVRKLGLK